MQTLYESMSTEEIGRRVGDLDMASSTFLRTPPPSHDPIMTTLFTTIGFSSAGIAGTSISAASIAGAIATTNMTGGIIVR